MIQVTLSVDEAEAEAEDDDDPTEATHFHHKSLPTLPVPISNSLEFAVSDGKLFILFLSFFQLITTNINITAYEKQQDI